MEYIKLSNGVEMPSLGYGVFLVSPGECERCVSDALGVGYRLIDTAQTYANEDGVGKAWRKSGIPREELAAIGAKYGKSAAQVALRWLTQRGIVAIPKSSNKERMAQNFDIFDFSLPADDMARIAKLNRHDTGTVHFGDPQFVKYLIEHYG